MTSGKRCYLHVGLPKTGTSYLQSVLGRSREALAAQDVQLLPGTRSETFQLMLALRGLLRPHVDPPSAYEALDRFREAATGPTRSTVVVTHELLGGATTEQAATLVEALEGFESHLVVTVRDLASWAPSCWQQHVKNRGTDTLDEYLDRVAGLREGGASVAYDVGGVLDRWAPHFPPDRVHVVTVPPSGTDQRVLLERFCGVLGVDPEALTTDVTRSNTSLGLVQTEVLRSVNVALGDRLPAVRGAYGRQVKRFLTREVLRPQGGTAARMPERLAEWCTAASEQLVARIEADGYDVAGELHDLLPAPTAYSSDPQAVSDADVAAAAAEALAVLLDLRAEEQEELDGLRRKVRRQRQRIRQLPAPRPSTLQRLARRVRAH